MVTSHVPLRCHLIRMWIFYALLLCCICAPIIDQLVLYSHQSHSLLQITFFGKLISFATVRSHFTKIYFSLGPFMRTAGIEQHTCPSPYLLCDESGFASKMFNRHKAMLRWLSWIVSLWVAGATRNCENPSNGRQHSLILQKRFWLSFFVAIISSCLYPFCWAHLVIPCGMRM